MNKWYQIFKIISVLLNDISFTELNGRFFDWNYKWDIEGTNKSKFCNASTDNLSQIKFS